MKHDRKSNRINEVEIEQYTFIWSSTIAKNMWRLLEHHGLWKQVMIQRYINTLFFENWIVF